MVKRQISFDITAEDAGGTVLSVMPKIPQYGGIKGEHNATELLVSLTGAYQQGELVRLQFTTGDGTILSSDLIEDFNVSGDRLDIAFTIPKLLTIAAGQLCVRVVLARLNEDDEEEVVVITPEMVLWFEESSVENGTPFWTGVSEMLHRTVAAKDAAVNAQESAVEVAEKAVQARDAAYSSAQTASQQATVAKDSAQAAQTAAEKAQEAVDTPGRQGASAYAVAVANGFEGDEVAWLASLKGKNGKSAYDTAVSGGFKGTEDEFAVLLAEGDSGTVHFKGQVASGTQLVNIAKRFGDVWFIENDAAFYMWNGSEFKLFGSGGGGGVNGITPHIGENGNWFIGLNDTGVPAKGEDGTSVKVETYAIEGGTVVKFTDATSVKMFQVMNGVSPRVGANGNWFIGETDTGVKARGTNGIYFGSDEPPEDYAFQFDEDGEVFVFDPDPATEDMTQSVGITEDGKLVTAPSAGGTAPSGGDWEYIGESTPDNQLIFENGKYKEFFVSTWFKTTAKETNRYIALVIDGDAYLGWSNITAANAQCYWGLFNRKMSLTYLTNNQASYPVGTERGNASMALKHGSNTNSLGTCFWYLRTSGNADNVIEDFGIKLWGRR